MLSCTLSAKSRCVSAVVRVSVSVSTSLSVMTQVQHSREESEAALPTASDWKGCAPNRLLRQSTHGRNDPFGTSKWPERSQGPQPEWQAQRSQQQPGPTESMQEPAH